MVADPALVDDPEKWIRKEFLHEAAANEYVTERCSILVDIRHVYTRMSVRMRKAEQENSPGLLVLEVTVHGSGYCPRVHRRCVRYDEADSARVDSPAGPRARFLKRFRDHA